MSTFANAYEMSCSIYDINVDNSQKGAVSPPKTGLHYEHTSFLVRHIPDASVPLDEGTWIIYISVLEIKEAANTHNL